MESMQKQGNLIGYYHFGSKDKTKQYYIVQVMFSNPDVERGNLRATVCSIFTTEEIYKKIIGRDIGSVLDIEISPQIETGKLNLKVLL